MKSSESKIKKSTALRTAGCVSVFMMICAGILFVASQGGTEEALTVFAESKEECKFMPTVLDATNKKPLSGAQVCVLETGLVYSTNERGQTEPISVPFIRDTRFDKILKKTWGECNIVVFKEGYIPYTLFYLQVSPDKIRNGPEILLFNSSSSENPRPFSIIEGPNREWVDAIVSSLLLEKNKPSSAQSSP